ncbi:MAG: energy-coupling factor transporter transmembrane component T [Thermoleophilaceae bacterium]
MRAGIVPVYRRRPSALHAARAGASLAFCGALSLVVVLFEHPLVLAAALAAAWAAGTLAGVASELRRSLRLALPFALLIMLINPIVSQQGDTLLVRGWEVLGQRWDVTLEALAYGGVAALRLVALLVVFGLLTACVDPDDLLRLFRRVSYRSALTAALTTRLAPVLARDALRMGDAARCRAVPAGRGAVARAALANALDRAVDVAAALEVRGYAGARRPARTRAPWSRHDLRVGVAALAIAAGAVAAKAGGVFAFEAYPLLSAPVGPAEAALALVLPLVAAVPLLGAAARLGVAARA